MKRMLLLGFVPVLAAALWSDISSADAVGLQLAPLEYEQTITSKIQAGFIDVGNPSDSAVNVTTSVEGFRQTDSSGDLAYFDDPQLSAAITPGLSTFTMGPRESDRVSFTINPAKLPAGGVYAVIFFQTVPTNQSADSSYVSQSAKVGTLLVLNNGGVALTGGSVGLKLSRWQFGNGLHGEISYAVADGQVGLVPSLTSKAYPWGKPTKLSTGLVLPGSTRNFVISRPGAFIGLIPVRVTDATNGHVVTRYVIAITGWYQTLIALLIAFLLTFVFRRWRRPVQGVEPVTRQLDGLSKPD